MPAGVEDPRGEERNKPAVGVLVVSLPEEAEAVEDREPEGGEREREGPEAGGRRSEARNRMTDVGSHGCRKSEVRGRRSGAWDQRLEVSGRMTERFGSNETKTYGGEAT